MVGADEAGERLLGEMAEVGLNLRYVGPIGKPANALRVVPDLSRRCSGGNVTENDSACAAVDAGWIAQAEPEFARFSGVGIALGAARSAVGGASKVAGVGHDERFPADRILHDRRDPGAPAGELHDVDLLALNLDEAAALVGVSAEGSDSEAVVRAASGRLGPEVWLSVTAGARG